MASITVRDDAERAALDAILALINAGTGDTTGDFEVLNSSNTSLAVMTFSATAFASSSSPGGIATAQSNTITQSPSATAGTIANGRFRDKANSPVVTFDISATGGGGAMQVTDPVIPANATGVSCSGVTVTLNVTA